MPNENTMLSLNNVSKAYLLFEQSVLDKENNPYAPEDMLNKIIPALMKAPRPLVGDEDDFHNFSVAVLKEFDDYRVALDIVEMGLEVYPKNADLLGDAIKYAVNCGQRDKATKYYDELIWIDKSVWTWRSFSFSIDYLLNCHLAGNKKALDEAIALVAEYKEYYPLREDPWKCEEDIYTKTNQIERSIQVLKAAISTLVLCPKCWLRYADLMMDQGNYSEAAVYLKKLSTNPISAESVNMAYVFYLDGLCRMTLWQQTDAYQDEEYDTKTIKAIYRRFRKALNHSDCRNNLKEKIMNLARSIYQETYSETKVDPEIEGIDK